MSWTKDELLKGLRCERCEEEGNYGFGKPRHYDQEMWVYMDLSGCTRVCCRKHVPCGNKNGAMLDSLDEEGSAPWFGAQKISDILGDDK